MASSKSKKTSKARPTNGDRSLIPRLTGDAQQLLARNRDDITKAIDRFRKDVEKRAQRAVRDVERKILKQMHVATEDQLRSLEARVVRLERRAQA